MRKFVLAIDQGTTSSRAIIFDDQGNQLACAQREFTQIFPREAWVEHDPEEIWSSTQAVITEVLTSVDHIDAIGITNQRETTIVWDATTGKPIYNAIVWQDRRTSEFCQQLRNSPQSEIIASKTGLIPDAYFSASKIRWILQNVQGAEALALRGQLRFGTVDSWLIWKLTQARVHATDPSNASRTMLFNISTLDWDDDLLNIFSIPASMLPQLRDSSGIIDYVDLNAVLDLPSPHAYSTPIPLAAAIGDQQSALFGQLCFTAGSTKCTYGTGGFLLMNTGSKIVRSKHQLLSTVAWKIGDRVDYAMEGSVFVAGAVVQWLRDGLQLIRNSADIEALARQVSDSGGVVFVPALTGLGAPHWDSSARGLISGITRGTTAAHIARAALEGIAFQVADVAIAMQGDAELTLNTLRVDGGASRNELLMQMQADILQAEVVRPQNAELTALGAAFLAGLAVGVWASLEQLQSLAQQNMSYLPSQQTHCQSLSDWHIAVNRSKN